MNTFSLKVIASDKVFFDGMKQKACNGSCDTSY